MISQVELVRRRESIRIADVSGLANRSATLFPRETPRGSIHRYSSNASVRKRISTRAADIDPRRRVDRWPSDNHPFLAGRDWPATIDTGFNGDLELPDALREALNARYVGRATAALAGGQSIEEDVYLVEIAFDGRMVQAETSFVAGSGILIGTRLLQGYALRIDFVARTVELERL